MRSKSTFSKPNRRAVVLAAAILTFAFVTASAAPASPTTTAKGEILSVDAGAKVVRVSVTPANPGGDPTEISVTVDPQTKILKAGRAVALADLKAGDAATVVYRSTDGSNVAISIVLQEQ